MWVDNQMLCTEYFFEADAGKGMLISIKLNNIKNDTWAHTLTFSIFKRPNEHAVDLQLMSNWYGGSSDYEVTLAKENNKFYMEDIVIEEAEKYIPSTYQGIVLNTDFNFEDDKLDTVELPDFSITSKANEKVRLAYRIGNYDDMERMVLVLFTQWKQQNYNDVEFKCIKNKKGYLGYGVIEFTAPETPGKYEIVGLLTKYPFQEKKMETYVPNGTSYRLTLVVE